MLIFVTMPAGAFWRLAKWVTGTVAVLALIGALLGGLGLGTASESVPSPPAPQVPLPQLSRGSFWYTPTAMAWMSPKPKYAFVPAGLTPQDPYFCNTVSSSYYSQPSPVQTAAWQADCPES